MRDSGRIIHPREGCGVALRSRGATSCMRCSVGFVDRAPGESSRGRVGSIPGLEMPAMARSLRSLARVLRHQVQRAPLAPASLRPSPSSCAQAGAVVAWCNGAGSLRFMSGDHTAKWMQNTDKKSPMELIAEVPPIKVDARVAACEGGMDPALGHPIEYISLDGAGPHVCKYCGLRYYQGNAHGHH